LKAAYSAGSNSVVVHQNSRRTWEALKRLELLVVADFFMTPTAELADYVLPPATWLERDDVCDFSYGNYISARQKAVEPLGECWHDIKIVIELVKRIPWADRKFLPWKDVDEFNNSFFTGPRLTFQSLQEEGYVTVPWRYRKHEENGFDTPTGKVELYSTALEKYGYDPLPSYVEPPESPMGTPNLIKDYPLILYTGGKHIEYFHSEGRQIPRLRNRVPDPEIELHPDTARQNDIEDGDWVWVESPQIKGERARFRAKHTTDVHPRMVHTRHGWWLPEKPAPEHGCFDSNINVTLSYGPPMEAICGSVALRGTLCKIYK
jgi:anaerobic selenocysteine-containing dehydrogenase